MAKTLPYTVLAVAGGALIGGAVTYLMTSPKMPQLGSEVDARLARIKLQDTVVNQKLSLGAIFSVQQEGNLIFYTLGYGLFGKAPNDVIMELVKNTTSNTWLANFAKLGNNSVGLYLDNVLQVTLPNTGGVAQKTLQSAFVWISIP